MNIHSLRRLGITFILILINVVIASAQPLSLDSCRNLALKNNKAMRIVEERVKASKYKKQEAFSAYLPGFDFAASYLYNQKEISLLSEDQMLPTKTFNPATGKYDFNILMKPDGTPMLTPDGQVIPTQVALIPKEAMTYDVTNVFAGAVTLTQPVFMGGKIMALNKMAKYAESLAAEMRDNTAKEMIYNVDVAYWQVVSLGAKKKLADSYVELLDTLRNNVNAMIQEGVATKSDLLTVEVKLNEANIDLTRVNNGLALSRMALAQICGLPMQDEIQLEDEGKTFDIQHYTMPAQSYNMADIYSRRNDLRSLELAGKIFEQKQNVARASMLPNLAVVGAYNFSNPNVFNGFDKSVKGMFSVGAMLKIPLWHWGANINKYRSAKSETLIKSYELDEAKEKIELQVNQAAYKSTEAAKTRIMTEGNLDKAEENLRQAQLGYREGIMPIDNVMAAQTAWLKANSENIDAAIEVRLCDVYLSKALGTLTY